MKKFFILISLSIVFLSACVSKNIINISAYKYKCANNDETACARYLFLESWHTIKHESYMTNIDKQNWNYWTDRYLDKIQTKEDAYVAIQTMAASLDDIFTRFLTPDELAEQQRDISGKLSGIGVVISSSDNGNIKIEDVIENSPAFKNNLKQNDIILKINDKSVAGSDIKTIANLIRGKKGTSVKLLLLRDKNQFEKIIIRDDIKIKSVSSKIINNDILYIRISTFMSEETSKEFLDVLTKNSNAKRLIIDLRDNPGGLLQNAVFIANILLKDGVIVSVWSKNSKEFTNVQTAGLHDNRPLVVLTNGMSASASEILAAALQENNRAVLVGEKTYGKGIIQRIIPLPMNTAMNVTIAKYLTPKNHDIHKNGIKPDWEVKYTFDDAKNHKDPQLDKAVKIVEEIKLSN